MQLLLYFLLLLAPVDDHKFYVSLTDILYNIETGRLEVSSKYFIDDLELALELDSGHHISMPMDDSLLPSMSEYMRNHLTLSLDERPVELTLLGYELDDDVVWLYLESDEIPRFSSVSVVASQLTELFDQQQNIVHVSNDGVIQSLFLRKEKVTGSLSYK